MTQDERWLEKYREGKIFIGLIIEIPPNMLQEKEVCIATGSDSFMQRVER